MSLIIAHTSTNTSGTCCPVTAPINTTGANAIYIFGQSTFTIGTPAGGYDNKGNTWTQIGDPNSSCSSSMIGLRCFNPIVGSGHTFSISGSPSFSTEIIVIALNVLGLGAAPYFNTRLGNQVNPVQAAGGGILMPVANGVFVSAGMAGCGWSGAAAVDSGFTIIEAQSVLSAAYFVQGSPSNINPTWSTLAPGGIGGSTGATILESMGIFPPIGGNWQVYEA